MFDQTSWRVLYALYPAIQGSLNAFDGNQAVGAVLCSAIFDMMLSALTLLLLSKLVEDHEIELGHGFHELPSFSFGLFLFEGVDQFNG